MFPSVPAASCLFPSYTVDKRWINLNRLQPPVRPEPAEDDPENTITGTESGTSLGAQAGRRLLAQGGVFPDHGETPDTDKEDPTGHRASPRPDQVVKSMAELREVMERIMEEG